MLHVAVGRLLVNSCRAPVLRKLFIDLDYILVIISKLQAAGHVRAVCN